MSDSWDPEGRTNPLWREAVRRDNEAWERSSENAAHRLEQQQIAKLKRQRDDLLAALKGVIRVADRATDEFDTARAAIAAAEADS